MSGIGGTPKRTRWYRGGGIIRELVATVKYDENADSLTITNEYAAEGSATLSAKKATNANLGDKTFQFQLLDGEDNVLQTSAAVKQGQTATFESIQYTLADLGDENSKTYTYKIKEVIPTDAETVDGKKVKDGVTYDESVKEVTVVVTNDGNGKLTVTYNGQTTFTTPEFSNTYAAEGSGEVKVQKVLNGRAWTNDDKFTFTISAAEGTPMPANRSITIAKSDADQIKSFGVIKFTEAGTYTYTVKESKEVLVELAMTRRSIQ